MGDNSNKINSIQLLRAIAVILVVQAHAIDIQSRVSFQKKLFHLENFGAAGVDLFFVISGFIITIISAKYAENKVGLFFLIKRIVRVMPLYWLVSLLCAVLLYIHNGKLYNAASIVKTITLIPFLNGPGQAELVLFQAWTLYFEMFFYLVTSIAIMVYSKKYMFVTVVFFSGLILLNHLTGNQYAVLVFAGNGIMIEFLLGVIAGVLFSGAFFIRPFFANGIFIAGIAGFAATILLGYKNISEAKGTLNGTASVWRSIIWGLPSFLLVAGLVLKEKTRRVKIASFWTGIGNASFSIYLTHALVLQSMYVRWTSWGLQQKLAPDIQLIISVALTVSVGYVFFRLVELPLLRHLAAYVNRLKKRGPAKEIQQQI